MDKGKKRKKLGSGESLEDRIAPGLIGGVTGIDEVPEIESFVETTEEGEARSTSNTPQKTELPPIDL